MISLNNKNICENCFSYNTSENVCPECGFDPAKPQPENGCLVRGTILLGRYLIGNVIGRGGFGITYLCYDMLEEKKVALKEYMPDAIAYRVPGNTKVLTYTNKDNEENFRIGSAKFYEEAKTIARFNGHPNIINVHGFFYENNTAYYVMEYLQGMDLKKYIEQKGNKLSWQESTSLMLPLLDALLLLHSMNILHRDISPDNVYITEDSIPKLLDFGSARQVLGDQSKSLSVILKMGFAPIEQYQTHGKQGAWTDIYAFAATLYYSVTGKVPTAAMDRVDEDTLIPPSEINSTLTKDADKVLLKALAVRSVNRYQNVVDFKTDLLAASSIFIPDATTEISENKEIASSKLVSSTPVEKKKSKREKVEARNEKISNNSDIVTSKKGKAFSKKEVAAPIIKKVVPEEEKVSAKDSAEGLANKKIKVAGKQVFLNLLKNKRILYPACGAALLICVVYTLTFVIDFGKSKNQNVIAAAANNSSYAPAETQALAETQAPAEFSNTLKEDTQKDVLTTDSASVPIVEKAGKASSETSKEVSSSITGNLDTKTNSPNEQKSVTESQPSSTSNSTSLTPKPETVTAIGPTIPPKISTEPTSNPIASQPTQTTEPTRTTAPTYNAPATTSSPSHPSYTSEQTVAPTQAPVEEPQSTPEPVPTPGPAPTPTPSDGSSLINALKNYTPPPSRTITVGNSTINIPADVDYTITYSEDGTTATVSYGGVHITVGLN